MLSYCLKCKKSAETKKRKGYKDKNEGTMLLLKRNKQVNY